MLEELIGIYGKKLTMTNLLLIWIVLIVFGFIFMFGYFQEHEFLRYGIIFLSMILTLFFLYAYSLKIRKKFKIKTKKLFWSKEFDQFKKKELIDYLTKHDLLKKEKLEIPSDLIITKTEEKKLGLYFLLGFSFTIFMVALSGFVGFIFNNASSFEESCRLLKLMAELSFYIFLISYFISRMFYDIVNSRKNRLKRLSTLLKEIMTL